jgi:FKBP-type peptidyl-prolyl cis-trans isomerase FkpA
MKDTFARWTLALGCMLACGCAAADEPKPVVVETDDQKALYAIGMIAATRLPQIELTAEELRLIEAGLADGLQGRKPKVDMNTIRPQLEGFVKARTAASATKEKAAGAEFAAKKATESGAQKLPSGLVYREVTPGTGASPQPTDTVKVKYKGMLRDGVEFDSSEQPVAFPLNGVVPCFSEGLAKMKVGGKSELVCPSDLAYGDQGRSPHIRPGATLLFEVELVEVVAAAAPSPAPTTP